MSKDTGMEGRLSFPIAIVCARQTTGRCCHSGIDSGRHSTAVQACVQPTEAHHKHQVEGHVRTTAD